MFCTCMHVIQYTLYKMFAFRFYSQMHPVVWDNRCTSWSDVGWPNWVRQDEGKMIAFTPCLKVFIDSQYFLSKIMIEDKGKKIVEGKKISQHISQWYHLNMLYLSFLSELTSSFYLTDTLSIITYLTLPYLTTYCAFRC